MDIVSSYAKPWVTRLLMSFIGAYVENLTAEQLDVGVKLGEVDLRDLRLKKSALDKLGLPFEVVEGRIGKFLFKLNWSVTAMANTPLQIEVEDVQLLVAATATTAYSREDEEKREQELKQGRLERAEAIRFGESTEQLSYTQSFINSIIARIVNNVQISIKNVHLRYEDKQTDPNHPFAAGFTLASLSAISVDDNWKPSYLDAKAQSIHKLAHLDSFAVYFDTDCSSLAGLSYEKAKQAFRDQISSQAHPVEHQYILSPVSGEGRIVLNKTWGKNGEPHYSAELLFEELGFTLDNHQYRDIISLADEYHVYARQHKYRRYRPDEDAFAAQKPKALWKFASAAILAEVHNKHRQWTWDYFRERRDDRHRYVELFKERQLSGKIEPVNELGELERKLSYHDIRFYRSIARSQLKKDKDAIQIAQRRQKQQQSWGAWIWGASSSTKDNSLEALTDEQRKGLYDILDYDEKAELVESFEASKESISAKVQMHLNQGSFHLRKSPHHESSDIVSLVFDSFDLGGVQRPDNFEASASLGSFKVFDGTVTNTLYSQIVHVKDTEEGDNVSIGSGEKTFFSAKFEYHPLDGRADNGLAVQMRSMEIIYQRTYIEAIVDFFRPPESQLQSVEALLNVAGDALQGFQKETRAGLEYALETHKTIDLQLDMHAPIIIVPESSTQKRCNHLVIDAGRVLVKSALADKEAIREIEKKRNKQYTEEDYKQLESMMYDNYSVQLIAAQFVIGESLEDCRRALLSEKQDPRMHLLERVNIDLTAQNSIVPSARSIARLKMSGRLPNLHVNFSDSKYKTLMRLIDATMPRLDNTVNQEPTRRSDMSLTTVKPSLFASEEAEYVVDDASERGSVAGDDSSLKSDMPAYARQHKFEFTFQVDSLQATLLRSTEDGTERILGLLALDKFMLKFALAQYDMKVNVNLGAINVKSLAPGLEELHLLDSESGSDGSDLMRVDYVRAQSESPDFVTEYGGFEQNVDIQFTTFVLRAVPEHVLPLYDFIMTTFVPNRTDNSGSITVEPEETGTQGVVADVKEDKIRVRARLISFKVLLIDGDTSIATMSLSTANVQVNIVNGDLDVKAHLGDVLIMDDSAVVTKLPEFKRILSIEGSEFAELTYHKFNETEAKRRGINSEVDLTTGALKLHFLDEPLNRVYLFLLKFAQLKGIYDAAASAAVQRASEVEKMVFRLKIRSPIVVFPVDSVSHEDVFILKLGGLSAKNEFTPAQRISASLDGLQLSSVFYYEEVSQLQMIEDVTISTQIIQSDSNDLTEGANVNELADFDISVDISAINLLLTERQYSRLLVIMETIPAVFSGTPELEAGAEAVGLDLTLEEEHNEAPKDDGRADLAPEVVPKSIGTGKVAPKKLKLSVSLPSVKLDLFDTNTLYEGDLKTHGIVRFALNSTSMELELRDNGALQAQTWIKSLNVFNTKSGPSKFREIIPASKNERDQFHCLLTMSGGKRNSVQLIATVDSPNIVFSVDPIFALSNFFLGGLKPRAANERTVNEGKEEQKQQETTPSKMSFSYRFDLYDASVSVLEDDQKADTQAIRLSLSRLSLSQQNALVLEMSKLGMFLTRMGKQVDAVRFLDEVDIKMASESRTEQNKTLTRISLQVEQELVLRMSYRDILLINSIVNKAISLFSGGSKNDTSRQSAFDDAAASAVSKRDILPRTSAVLSRGSSKAALHARVVMTTEELEASIEGFRLVLIGDFHELPMLHLSAKQFNITASDWSSQLRAITKIPVSINYWNLKNSHWEPFIDPWGLSVSIESDQGRNTITASSQELLNVNISSSFLEVALSMAETWNKEGDRVLKRARGSYAPYRILNRTGAPISIWMDNNSISNTDTYPHTKIDNGTSIEWRFEDWKRMREDGSSSSSHYLSVQFEGKPWERLRGVPVDREGEFIYSLRPRTKLGLNKVMCEVSMKDNVKYVTFRSTYKVENHTFYPLEIALVDGTGHPVYPIEKIAPGEDFNLPIEAVTQNKLRIQPDPGFGYKWSPPIWWEDLRDSRRSTGLSVKCPHMERKEAPFHFTLWPSWSSSSREYPLLKLMLRAPIELENLLPYDISYKVYDKDSNHNWNSFLRKGGNTPVHSVDLNHLVLLSVQIQDSVYEYSDFTIINANKRFEFDQEHQLALSDYQGRKLILSLNYVKFPDAGGAFKVQIYCPYIVVNQTGLPFGVKSVKGAGSYKDVAGSVARDQLSSNAPFLLSHSNVKGNEFVFRVGDSSWSQVIRFDAPSAEMAMITPDKSQKNEICMGLSWTEGTGKYKLTKVIEISPRFYVLNKLPQSLYFREVGSTLSGRSELQVGECFAMHNLRMSDRRLLTVAYPGLDAQWSSAIDMEAIGSVHIRMRPAGSTSRQDTHLIKVDVVLQKASIYIILSPHSGPWPFRIENKSDYEISFGQMDEKRERPEGGFVYKVKPGSRLSYAWDFPAMTKKKIYLSCNRNACAVDIMEIGVLPPLRHATGALSLDVRAEGKSQLLSITNYREENSIYKVKKSSASQAEQLGTQEFEAVQEEVPPNLILKAELKGLGISLMNKRLEEVVYFSMQDLNVDYSNSPVAQSVNLAVGTLQIDNQLQDAFFPVLLQPTPISKEARTLGALPTVQASIIILNDRAHGVLFIKYASILLQAITVQIDEAFLYAVLELTKLEGVSWDTDENSVLIEELDKKPPDLSTIKQGEDVYFEVLELQPIILSVSFVRNTSQSDDHSHTMTTRNPLAVALNVLTMTLANVEGVDLELNALGLTDVRLTLPDLQSRILYHYRQDVLRQIYRVLGSANFLGNPVGLFTNVSSGVVDIFYEPWHGVVQHGGSELGIGLAKGAASFVKKTIFGVSNSVTKVTSSLGKGLSAATLDADYQARRRMTQRRNRPRHALVGVATGAEAFASSVASGVEGVLMKPLEGADAEGALGFFKGMGKGIVGAVTKPVVGVFDLAANVTEGIRNTTTVFDAPQRDRARKPRCIPDSGILEPYIPEKALGQSWMRDLCEGKFRNDFYIAHIILPSSDNVVLLTNTTAVQFSSRDLRLQWELPLTAVAGVQGEQNGIRFASKYGKEDDKVIILQDATSREWFFNKIKNVVNAYNARRRLTR